MVRTLLKRGDLHDAGAQIDDLMNECAGVPVNEVLLVYSQYLLHRGRPFAAECVLAPLITGGSESVRAQLLHAQAIAEMGDVERARQRFDAIDSTETSGPIDTTLLTELLDDRGAERRARALAALGDQLRGLRYIDKMDPFSVASLAAADAELTSQTGRHQAHTDGPPELWAYFIGEACCQHLGAHWIWRRRVADSTVFIPVADGALELCPFTWAVWRLDRPEHTLVDLFGVLLRLGGTEEHEITAALGTDIGIPTEGYVAVPGRHPLTEALHFASECATRSEKVLALGLVSDSPFSRVELPVVVAGPDGPKVILFWTDPNERDAFQRFLDMLCLGPFARLPWVISSTTNPLPADVDMYRDADGGVRAALLARRLCTADPSQNARWAVPLARVLLQANLDGSASSIEVVDRVLVEQLRPGGETRWRALFEDRTSLLFILTSYVGELLRANYGGEWGADRITGSPIGPTSGLERGDVRFNLGAKILKRFYNGGDEPLLDSIREYAKQAGA